MVLAIFIFWSNPKERINQWCAAALVFFFLGVVKEAIMFEIIPSIQTRLAVNGLEESFRSAHNIFTWANYTLAMPTMTISGCYFGYINLDKKFKFLRYAIYIPGAILIFFFSPMHFFEYQLTSTSFWVVYTAYNFIFVVLLTLTVIKGILEDRKYLNKSSFLKKKKNRKLQETLLLLPPLYVWFVSVFPFRLFYRLGFARFDELIQFWEINILVIILSTIGAILLSIKGEGFLGIRILPTRYSYTYKMPNDEFMNNFSHRIKSETSYLYVLAEKTKDAIENHRNINDVYANIEVFSDKIQTLYNLSRKVNRYSSTIILKKDFYNLYGLIVEASRSDIEMHITIPKEIVLKCDRDFMIEVFKELVTNSAQAAQASNQSEDEKILIVIGRYSKSKYIIEFRDNGIGIVPNIFELIFDPGVTTKNKEFNSGMGLANCKKIVNLHGGKIHAENNADGSGVTVTIELPSKLVGVTKNSLYKGQKNRGARRLFDA